MQRNKKNFFLSNSQGEIIFDSSNERHPRVNEACALTTSASCEARVCRRNSESEKSFFFFFFDFSFSRSSATKLNISLKRSHARKRERERERERVSGRNFVEL